MPKRDLKDAYRTFLKSMRETTVLSSIAGLLVWDQETVMPRNATERRAEQAALLAGIVHEKFVDPAIGKLLKLLTRQSSSLNATERVITREHLRDYDKSYKLPAELVQQLSRVNAMAQAAWIEARKRSDFSMFAPWLTKMVDLKRRQADAYGYEEHPYDALLDDFEPRMTVAELDPLMDQLRHNLIPLINDIAKSSTTIDETKCVGTFPVRDQEVCMQMVMRRLGLDPNASRVDLSAHPFCIGISSPVDVRITTHYDENNLLKSLYRIIHESGHALYEQGLPKKFYGTPLGESTSIGIHESQSRLWENIIAHSKPFAHFVMPLLKRHFPQQLKGITANTFYRTVNKVSPSLIRIDADEVTYSPHVILRYEIEKGLIDGSIAVKKLPALWNKLIHDYIGLKPANDAEGVLQDTHWASGLIGYFPTYVLGDLYAAQLWWRIQKDIPQVDDTIAKGNFSPILRWLRTKIHRHGRRYSPKELIRRATGKPPDAKYYVDYLRAKYCTLYRISA